MISCQGMVNIYNCMEEILTGRMSLANIIIPTPYHNCVYLGWLPEYTLNTFIVLYITLTRILWFWLRFTCFVFCIIDRLHSPSALWLSQSAFILRLPICMPVKSCWLIFSYQGHPWVAPGRTWNSMASCLRSGSNKSQGHHRLFY